MPSNSVDRLRKLNEAYEDSLFRLIMDNAAEKEGQVLIEGNERLKPEDMNRFSMRLDSIMKKAKTTQKTRGISKIFTRTAAAILAIILVFSAMTLTVRAFRVQVLNFLISIEPEYMSLQLNVDDNEQSSGKLIVNWENAYVPTYVPEGYEVSGISYSNSIKKIIFDNLENDSTIIYTEYESMNSVAVDTEDASLIETIEINGQDGTISVKASVTTIAWSIDHHLFTVQGQISQDEAVEVAEGVKFLK